MVRKKIEIENGSIYNSKRFKWDLSKEKLLESEHCLQCMLASKFRHEYEMFWSRFADSIQQFFVRLEQEGKKSYSAFQPWIGSVRRFRKKDELLEYLYQVRNQSQHGKVSIKWSEPSLVIGKGFSGNMSAIRIFHDDSYEIDSVPARDSASEAKVEYNIGNPQLITFKNENNGKKYNPPKKHKSKAIKVASPNEVALLALEYYNELMKRAENKFN